MCVQVGARSYDALYMLVNMTAEQEDGRSSTPNADGKSIVCSVLAARLQAATAAGVRWPVLHVPARV